MGCGCDSASRNKQEMATGVDTKQMEGGVKRVWPHAKVYCTSIDKPAQKYADYVLDGVSLIVANSWVSRVMNHCSDQLGRWVDHTKRKKG